MYDDIDDLKNHFMVVSASQAMLSTGNLTIVAIALCSYPLVKMEIRDLIQILTTAPIF